MNTEIDTLYYIFDKSINHFDFVQVSNLKKSKTYSGRSFLNIIFHKVFFQIVFLGHASKICPLLNIFSS